MSVLPQAYAFAPEWPDLDPRFLGDDLLPPPDLPLQETFGPRWAQWITAAAEAKSSPPDYVVAGLLAVVGAAIGNTRWVSPWQGWAEPPILWTMAIGTPSSNKSPGLDAVLTPLKQIERELRQKAEGALAEWREAAEIAKLSDSAWREAAKAALKEGSEPPARPDSAYTGDEPFLPRLSIADGTVERLAVVVAKQPRGTLLARDELSGWLQGMTRYAGGGSDRPFWLEAYGGRGYTVERMGRDPVHIDHLSIGVTGGIQPDRLKTLLIRSDDDGLLARFLPIFPNPAPLRRPRLIADNGLLERTLSRLMALNMLTDEKDVTRPWLVPFSEPARDCLDALRQQARDWEADAEGLLLSFIGKLPGLTVRLSLVLAMLDWTAGETEEPVEISAAHFNRASYLISHYALPMARRSYADASATKAERAARNLIGLLKNHRWPRFSSRDVLRLNKTGLARASELNPALALLEEANAIRAEAGPLVTGKGRPSKTYLVNPAIF
jgi:hypothetical protein